MKARLLLTSLLFMSAPASATLAYPLQATQQVSVSRKEICRILRQLRDKDRIGDPKLSAGILSHARTEIDFLLDILQEKRVPALGEGEVQVLSKYQADLVLEALTNLGRSAVVDRLRERLAEQPGTPELTLGVQVLGAVGGRADLRWMLSLATVHPTPEAETVAPEDLEDALVRLLQRTPDTVLEFAVHRRGLPTPSLGCLVRAVGRTGDSRSLGFLADVLHWNPELVPEALAQVAKLGPSSDSQVNQEARLRVRASLEASQPMVCRSSALAVAALRDFEALPTLIELLDTEDVGLRTTVHGSLRQLTGKSFAPEFERWNLWHDRELRWVNRERAAAFRALRSPQTAEVVKALGEVLQHPTVREDLIVALSDLLEHRQAAVRAIACTTLADLCAEESLIPLTAALEDPSQEVAAAAGQAILKLTGNLEAPGGEERL